MILVTREIRTIEKQFKASGFPPKLIYSTINKTTEKMHSQKSNITITQTTTAEDEEEIVWFPLFINYSGEKAHQSIIKLRKALPSAKNLRVTTAYKSQKFHLLLPKFTTCNSTKEQRKFLRNNLVYKYTCSCGEVYVGETLRRLSIRISEHCKKPTTKTPNDSAIYKHVSQCDKTNGEVDENNFSIIQQNLRHKESRKRYESLYITFYDKKSNSSTMNDCKVSRELVCF